jgi:hypothetical protein
MLNKSLCSLFRVPAGCLQADRYIIHFGVKCTFLQLHSTVYAGKYWAIHCYHEEAASINSFLPTAINCFTFLFFLPAFAGFAIAPTSHRQIAINKQRQHTLALPNFYFPGAQPARSSCQKLLPEADSTSAT